jgi:uncharacterized protein (TIGR03086 family)
MDDFAALDRATEEFQRQLDAIGDDQWHDATPCGDWDVTALVEHVAGGNRMGELLLHGADVQASLAGARTVIGTDLRTAYASTSADQIAAFAEDGSLDRTVHHPAMDMPGSLLLLFRTNDLALHGWDLATAIGADTTIDPDLAASIWTRLEPIAPLLAGSGMFGTPTGALDPDASPVDKLLDATGR